MWSQSDQRLPAVSLTLFERISGYRYYQPPVFCLLFTGKPHSRAPATPRAEVSASGERGHCAKLPSMADELGFLLNGAPRRIADVAPTTTVLDYLRGVERACGTKEGCAEGDC